MILSPLFGTPENAGVTLGPREVKGEADNSDFVPIYLGTPENAGVTEHFHPLLGPREGRGEVANSDFIPLCLGSPRMQGWRRICVDFIWDGYGPSHTQGDFFDFKVGGHDGAYKGRIHVIVPFIGRKNGTLTARQQSYNDVHGWYRARLEQLFAPFWHRGLVRNIWRGGPNEFQSVRILLHFTQFCIRRQVRHPHYGPWEHVLPHVWTDQSYSAATQDEAEDEAEVCVCCVVRSAPLAVWDECKEHYCTECIDTHTCGSNVVC